jgi:hypothetical protein
VVRVISFRLDRLLLAGTSSCLRAWALMQPPGDAAAYHWSIVSGLSFGTGSLRFAACACLCVGSPDDDQTVVEMSDRGQSRQARGLGMMGRKSRTTLYNLCRPSGIG